MYPQPQWLGVGRGKLGGPGRPQFGGLSGAIGIAKAPKTAAFYTMMQALEQGAKRSGIPMEKEKDKPQNFMSMKGLQGQIGEPMAAPGMKPGMRGGLGMQTGAGLGRSSEMGLQLGSRIAGTR